jgi:hypothetical protein
MLCSVTFQTQGCESSTSLRLAHRMFVDAMSHRCNFEALCLGDQRWLPVDDLAHLGRCRPFLINGPTPIIFRVGCYSLKSSPTMGFPAHFTLVVGSDHKSYVCNAVTRNATSVGAVFA